VHGHTLADGQVISAFKHSNDLGSYLLISIFVFLAFLINFRKGKSVQKNQAVTNEWNIDYFSTPAILYIFCLFVAGLICLGMTYSRGAWVGFFVGLIVLGLINFRKLYIPLIIGIIFIVAFLPRMIATRNVSFFYDDHSRYQAIDKETIGKKVPQNDST